MALQEDLEAKIEQVIAQLEREHDGEPHLKWAIARALIHRGVHLAAEGSKPAIEYCGLATYLAEMVGHAHRIMHGDNPKSPAHKDVVH